MRIALAVLLVAWAATVLAAFVVESHRSRAREVLDAVALPLTMFTSKHKRGLALSMSRILLGGAGWKFFANFPKATQWGPWQEAALATILFALIVEVLFMGVPVREGLNALVAVFGSATAKRVRTEIVQESTVPAPEK